MAAKSWVLKREKYLDGHKIDYVKDKVAFDLEWNSKDQTFDRDLYAMNAFFLCGAIDVGVLVTRSLSMNDVFRSVGPALTRTGAVEKLKDGSDKPTMRKYGASTTWMGKLIYRLNATTSRPTPGLRQLFGARVAAIEVVVADDEVRGKRQPPRRHGGKSTVAVRRRPTLPAGVGPEARDFDVRGRDEKRADDAFAFHFVGGEHHQRNGQRMGD